MKPMSTEIATRRLIEQLAELRKARPNPGGVGPLLALAYGVRLSAASAYHLREDAAAAVYKRFAELIEAVEQDQEEAARHG